MSLIPPPPPQLPPYRSIQCRCALCADAGRRPLVVAQRRMRAEPAAQHVLSNDNMIRMMPAYPLGAGPGVGRASIRDAGASCGTWACHAACLGLCYGEETMLTQQSLSCLSESVLYSLFVR